MSASLQALSGGFSDPAIDAAFAFRAAMNVMARPGEIAQLDQATPPAPLSKAAGTLALTLCDTETGVYLAGNMDVAEVRDWITFHTGARFVRREDADFAFGTWDDLVPLSDYRIGTPEYPDRSATLVVEHPGLAASGSCLRGPGIRDTAWLSLPAPEAFAANNGLYPLGLDFFFTDGRKVAALPRSTAILEV